MNSVHTKVSERIANLGPAVESKVVEALLARETEKRSNALVQAIDNLDKLERNFKKLGPDQFDYDDKHEKIGETFSKTRMDERKKAQEKIDKFTRTINKALEKSDFADLYNLGSVEDKSDSGKQASAKPDTSSY